MGQDSMRLRDAVQTDMSLLGVPGRVWITIDRLAVEERIRRVRSALKEVEAATAEAVILDKLIAQTLLALCWSLSDDRAELRAGLIELQHQTGTEVKLSKARVAALLRQVVQRWQ